MFPWDTDPEDLVKTLEAEGCEQIFIDQLSPRRIGRPELEKMLRELCRGDVLVIEEFSRLGRSLRELLELIARIADTGTVLVSRKENLDTSTETGRAMLSMLLALNHFRFDLMAPTPAKKEPTRERAGKPVRPEDHKPRRENTPKRGRRTKWTEEDKKLALSMYDAHYRVKDILEKIGICRTTLFEWRHERDEKQNP